MKVLRHLLLLLPALLWPALFSAKPAGYEKTPFPITVAPTLGCPAPAPDSLWATNITPNSISLAWSPVIYTGPVYYKVQGNDLTAGIPLLSYITTNTFITYSGLTAGHTYRFSVSATYCLDGPFGEARVKDVVIPIIIVDDIVELQSPCTPGNPQSANAGAAFAFCVQQSVSANEPYTNGFIGSITYSSQQLQFAVAYNGTDIIIGELSTNNLNFSFQKINDSEVRCYHDVLGVPTTALFTVNHMNGTQFAPQLNIKFHQNCGDFSTCGSPCGVVERSDDGFTSETPTEILADKPYPNPFSEFTVFRYELNEDAPVEINLYDAVGRLVRSVENTTLQSKGQHEVLIKGADLLTGVYFLHTRVGGHRKVFVLVKRE